jgi:hypothetical protein
MVSGVSLETCWAIDKHWNNKLQYTVASCWSFLYDSEDSHLSNIPVVNVLTHIFKGSTKLSQTNSCVVKWWMNLTWLGAWENFHAISHHESFRLYGILHYVVIYCQEENMNVCKRLLQLSSGSISILHIES